MGSTVCMAGIVEVEGVACVGGEKGKNWLNVDNYPFGEDDIII